MRNKYTKIIGVFTFTTLAMAAIAFVGINIQDDYKVSAATIITVNSTADDTVTDTECTLREAINNANNGAGGDTTGGDCEAGSLGADTINFAITSVSVDGGGSFTNQTKTGYTIQPTSTLPSITETVTIDGHSQPDSKANKAVAPNPLNGILLIEIDGTNAGSANGFNADVDGVTIKGMVINSFSQATRSAISVNSTNLKIQGNYIGVEPDGMTVAANDCGACQGADNSSGAQIGGLLPEQRNLISGNSSTGSSPNTGSDNWVYQGNYFGVAKDGLTAVPNAQISGSGSISLDNSNGHVVGGSQPGAINVFSGNNALGIAPSNSDDLLIEGNYIGVGYDGITSVPNGSTGINISQSINSVIRNNIISYNGGQGINFNDNSSGLSSENNVIQSNQQEGISVSSYSTDAQINGDQIKNNSGYGVGVYVSSGVSLLGSTISGNSAEGVFIYSSTATQVGGTSSISRNIISDNAGLANVYIAGFGGVCDGSIIQGNYIGTNSSGKIVDNYTQNMGIYIAGSVTNSKIGGSEAGSGNVIAGNQAAGVGVVELNVTGLGVLTPSGNAILGNSIASNESGTALIFPLPGLGIDQLSITGSVDPGGFTPESITNDGVNSNDAYDSDTGPNNYINFPKLNSATQNDNDLTVNLDLDAKDSTLNDEYRVELFANDTADDSGFGEGQTYLGSATITNGDAQDVTITMTNGTNLTGKVLSATTTALTNDGDGFGSTSEFSEVLSDVTVLSTATTPPTTSTGGTLGRTGDILSNWYAILGLAFSGIGSTYYAFYSRRKKSYKL